MARDRGDWAGFAAECTSSLMLKPGFAPALADLEVAEFGQGHDAAGVAAGRAFLAAKQSSRRDMGEPVRSILAADDAAWMASTARDVPQAVSSSRSLLSLPLSPSWRDIGLEEQASALLIDHDPNAARRVAAGIAEDSVRSRMLGQIAASEADPSGVALLRRAIAGDPTGGYANITVLGSRTAWLALALARSGDLAGAATTIGTTPLDCTFCVRVRGIVASLAGRTADAEHWFATAIGQAPELPQGYVERGGARLQAGDVEGALADAKNAARYGPHDPDAQKLFGDVLARKGRWDDARDRYEAALRLAPAWTAARQARDAATARN